jgi:hypothetical protein
MEFFCKRAPNWTITKWKAYLCPHGGTQVEGSDFWATYSPVITWSSPCLVLTLSLITGLQSHQIVCIQVYTQAPVDFDINMNVPVQFIVSNNSLCFSPTPTPGNCNTYVLLISKNLYGLYQASNNLHMLVMLASFLVSIYSVLQWQLGFDSTWAHFQDSGGMLLGC